MDIKLCFLGAAENVTGSRYLLQANGKRFLIDCGLYQERPLRERNWGAFPVEPASLDAVLLTHAHLDHCGYLPRLVRNGFSGSVYCTAATAEIARIVLLDAAHLQEEDAAFKLKRHRREGRKGPYPVVPLYTTADAEACGPLFRSVRYEQTTTIADGIEATFHDAGHILGAAMIKLKISRNGQQRTILFSGDVGRPNKPILKDPAVFDEADYVLVESTYGDRVHQPVKDIADALADAVNATCHDGGNIVIPSFAIERSQELLYYLNQLLLEDRIPHLMIFMDSPMAINVTEVFENHPDLFDQEMLQLLRQDASPFDFPGLVMTRTTRQSKAINHITGTAVIIAGSGMCTGGRIKHHLVNNITRRESCILFVGYQAKDTLGRQIVDGAEQVRILGQMYQVKAKVVRLHGFSAHADRNELFGWLSALEKPPRRVFVVHGEAEAAHGFAKFVGEKTGWQVAVAKYKDQVNLQ